MKNAEVGKRRPSVSESNARSYKYNISPKAAVWLYCAISHENIDSISWNQVMQQCRQFVRDIS